jgi:Domain of unknown function (DUF4082)/Bacterial Ig domain
MQKLLRILLNGWVLGASAVVILGVVFVVWFMAGNGNDNSRQAADVTVAFIEPRAGETVDESLYVRPRIDRPSVVSRVEMYLGGVLRHTSYSHPFDATIDTSQLVAGKHTLTIKLYDNSGKILAEKAITIVVAHKSGQGSGAEAESNSGQATATTAKAIGKKTTSGSSGGSSGGSGSVNPGDTTAPTAPAGLIVAAAGLTTAALTWNASSDNVAVTSYRIYRNGILAISVQAPLTTFNDTGRNPGNSYSYTVRAVDAAGNLSASSASVGITMPSATIWPNAAPDSFVTDDPGVNVNYGVKFRPKVDGTITGVRFYKTAGNTGEHLGALWTEGGLKLADVTFTGETATGWQTANFSLPVDVTAGTIYVASYHTNEGNGAVTPNYFATNHETDYIEALSSAEAGGNGLFAFNDFLIFPTDTFNSANYWVDVVFTPAVEDSHIAFASMPRIPWEGGPSYYAPFSPADTSPFINNDFFPIAVWAESVLAQGNVDLDKGAGLNTYLEMTADTDLSIVRDNGMQNISGEITGYGSETVGWMVSDEVDMWGGAGDGAWTGNFPGDGDICNPTNDPCGYTIMDTLLAAFPADTRFRFANFGKGVVAWYGDADAERFVNDYTDAAAADMYFYTDPFMCDPGNDGESNLGIPSAKCRQSSSYGVTMDRMRYLDTLDGQRQPIYAFIENNHPFTESSAPTITPDQLAGAVMNSLIHEARGIIYFNHSFGGSCGVVFHVLREACGATIRPKVIETNARITALAEVLNTQSYEYNFNHKLDTMLKAHDGSYYIFAMTKQDTASGSYSFTLPAELAGAASVEVMFESRTLSVSSGAFTDSFAAEYSYHVYRVTP